MADHFYLELLQQGKEVWNQWRTDHRDIREIDLSTAHLRGKDLSHYTLTGVNFQAADLQEANLSRAYLCPLRLPKGESPTSKFAVCSYPQGPF